jgi:hypothetical protein
MSQLKVNALVSYSGNTVTLGTSGDTINVASGVTFNTASATVNLPTTIKVSTIQNTNSTNLITQTNVTTITFGATSQTISVPSVASFASTIGVGGATPAASGAGVSFPASASASSDANTLDDYEEGTFTPTIISAGGSNPTVTYGTQDGVYTKIGNRVCFNIYILIGTYSGGTGEIVVGNLPFTSSATYLQGISVGTSGVDIPAGRTSMTGYVPPSSTRISLLAWGDNVSWDNGATAWFAASDELMISGTYRV